MVTLKERRKKGYTVKTMRRFLLTAVRDVGRPGKIYWMASYPKEGPKGRAGSTPRKQKKFADKEEAEIFLEQQRKRYEEKWRWEYWSDTRLRNDIARAVGILSEIPGGSLEVAAGVYVECRSAQEWKAAKGYKGPKKVEMELSGRLKQGLGNVARRRGMRIEDLVSGILWGFIEEESREAELAGR